MSVAPHPSLQDFVVEIDGIERLSVRTDGRRHTVELRDPRNFEDQIIDRLVTQGSFEGVSGAALPVKGEWIHGWLETGGEDYINRIHKNWLFFVRYLEARTAEIENVSTFQRAPGTYSSTYRYILLLEDLNLVERFKRVEVPPEEYNHPVPEEFRMRTFVRVTTPFDEAQDEWNNPHEALYPGGELPDEGVQIEVEPEDEEESGLAAFTPPEELEDEEVEEADIAEGASINNFPQLDELEVLINEFFIDSIELTFDEAPIDVPDIDEDDFDLGRIAIVGDWADDDAEQGVDDLFIVVSIDNTRAARSPGFIPPGVERNLSSLLNENNQFEDWFPSYRVSAIYDDLFTSRVRQIVRAEQENERFYNLEEREFESI